MAVLITGGAGFIGSYVNRLLTKNGYYCVVLDDLSHGDPRSVIDSPFFKGDISDKELIAKIVTKFNIQSAMHFAAHINVRESVDNPSKYYANNVCKTLALLTHLKDLSVKKIVFSSSAAVYGIPQEERITESHPLAPINPYGESKLICEKILKDFSKAYDFRYISLRYFNAAGGDPEGVIKIHMRDQSNLIPRALSALLDGNGEIPVFGTDWPTKDGSGVRDYIHIHDLASAHMLALAKLQEGCPSAIYNLGNGSGYSVLEVLSSVEKITGKTLNRKFLERREGDPPVLVADATKAKRELQWAPVYLSIDKMVQDAWSALSFEASF
ncbi:UDP-glucose 4-epimerase GalE [Estrella lausannensis]|uniref:UDP-glucose 4-epimerase n=1 Tax=Estrella lausannensis TaxID=483423 RepID=A0A0H5DS29_9BACT|nr:UDP-glucose 4-epimerase GalE [Estrella lausannensis]CRX38534.1 UDP-glucose 4-epimerase [Estrella lausannensis]